MHPIDVENTLKSFKILVDSREQDTEQARKRYATFRCDYQRHKLDFGDYSCIFTLPNGKTITLEKRVVIERKYGLSELCMCYTKERGRFKKEFERAAAYGAKTYLLIENSSWESAYSGRYRSQMKPQALVASMLAWLARYNCQIIMCKAESSGKLIRDILYREAKERLEKGDFDDQ